MEITFVNEYYPPYVTGGTELFLQALAEFLVKKKHRVNVVCTMQKGLKNKEKINGVNIHRIKSSPVRVGHRYQFPGLTFYFNHFNRKVKKKVKEVAKDSDIVYISNSRHLSLAPFQAAREMGKKIVFDIHDYWPICFKKDMFKKGKVCDKRSAWECTKCILYTKKLSLLSALMYPCMKVDYLLRDRNILFDKAVCHSEWMKEILPYETEVINYPIRRKVKGMKPKRMGKPLGLLYMGRIENNKGVGIFPQMARILKRKKVDFHLSFMGSGKMERELKKKMKGMPVTFHGWVSDFERKRQIFSENHILLAPSIWAEPFGMIATEAMSFATPSIVSNFGGLKETVEKNKVGVAAKPDASSFAKATSSITPSMYSRMSRNCLKSLGNYDKEKVMRKYLSVFKSLL